MRRKQKLAQGSSVYMLFEISRVSTFICCVAKEKNNKKIQIPSLQVAF